MLLNRYVLLIPDWFERVLKRNNRPMSDLTSLSSLRELFSVQDIAGLVALNDNADKIFGFRVGLSLGFGAAAIWYSKGTDEEKAYLDKFISPVRENSETLKTVTDRLFLDINGYDKEEKPFITYDLGRDVSGIVINTGHFTGIVDPSLQMQLIKSVLQLLYVYIPHKQVAQTELAKKYLELLA